MKRLLGQTLAVVVVGILGTALTPACAENDQTIFVRSALAPPLNRINGQCIYTVDPAQTKMSAGALDALITPTYFVTLLVGNQLVARSDDKSSRAESNRVHINGAVVRVTDPNGGVISEFTSLGSDFIDPETNNAPSYGVVTLAALDAKTTAQVGANLKPLTETKLVTANMKVFGTTLGGKDVESSEFQFPIRICRGCLLDFTTGDDPAAQGRDCNLPLATSSATTVLPCTPGQDEKTPCQLCVDSPDPATQAACRGQL